MKEIGNKIKLARELARLTQEDLEKKSGVSQALISRIEAGDTAPTVTKWLMIVKAIGLPIEYFIPDSFKEVLKK